MPPRSKEEIRVVACLFFILFVGVADQQILSPLLPAIRNDFAKSSTEMGFLFTGYAFCAGLSVLLWGPLSDVFGRKKGLLNGLIVFSVGAFISCLSISYSMLLAGRILTGMGASMLSLNSLSYAADFFPYAHRGWAMGSIFSSYFAALILGVPLGAWLGDKLGWNAVFGIVGGIALLLFLATKRLLPKFQVKPTPTGAIPPSDCIRRYIGFLKVPSFLGALFSSLFASAGTTGFLAFLGVWLHDSFGIPGSKIGLVFLPCGAAALLASPLAGLTADRIGKRLQFVLSSLCLALFLLMLPGLKWGIALFAIFGVISLAAAFRQGPMEALLTEIVSAGSRGSFVALKNSFSQMGIGLAALLSGILFEHYGYSGVCFLCALANLLAAFCMLFTLKDRHL
jgi:DHA1 family purine base/nucleoside efflux pump-like MFS transporter